MKKTDFVTILIGMCLITAISMFFMPKAHSQVEVCQYPRHCSN